jgi:hypothetical protein
MPGTATCNTIHYVEIDTGSVGLRLLADNPELTLNLPAVTDASSHPLAECLMFADGDSWGSVVKADFQLPESGQKVAGMNVHIIGAASAGPPPTGCIPSPPLMTENTVPDFGANGILGVGPFINDCNSTGNCNGTGAAVYYSCPAPGNCATISATTAQQLPNPATLFAKDNNGVIIELPPVASAGQASLSGGVVVFGIDTETNNSSSGATKLSADLASGFITGTLNGKTYADTFLDSGSNAIFFADSSIVACTAPNTAFYCPATAVNQNATLNNTLSAPFTVGNADQLFGANPSFNAFNNIGGTNSDPSGLDLGLPFFFGRNVFTGFENVATNAPPFFAY